MVPPAPPLAVENGPGDQAAAASEGAEGKRQLQGEMMPEKTLKQPKKPRFEAGSCSRSTGPEKKFMCSVCNREFESYHALGGINHTTVWRVLRRLLDLVLI